MSERLVVPLGLDPERVRLPDGTAADPDAEANRCRLELEADGGVGRQVLGLGLNAGSCRGRPGRNCPLAGCICIRGCWWSRTRPPWAAATSAEAGHQSTAWDLI